MADAELSDDELAELALAADPDTPVGEDAVPLWNPPVAQLLPAWYMPTPAVGVHAGPRWARWVAVVIIAAFVAINAYGLCSTYGPVAFG